MNRPCAARRGPASRPGALGAAVLLAAALGAGGAPGPSIAPTGSPFLPGIVSTDDANELTPAPTPAGDRLFFARWRGVWGGERETVPAILVAERGADGWQAAETVAFSGRHADEDPSVSPDGRWLWFTSERPAGSDEAGSADLWRVALGRDGAPRGVPERLPAPLSSPAAEYSPVAVAAGHLYFASDRAGGPGQGDVYRAAWDGERFAPPEPLGPAVNSPTGEWNVWVDAEEREMIFEASSRATNVSVPGDLYLSVRGAAGWSPAVPLAAVNGEGSDLMGRVAGDPPRLLWTAAPIGGRASVRETAWEPVRSAALEPLARSLLVANRSSHELSRVSLLEGRVTATVAVGRGPHLLSNVEDGRVLATGYGVFPEPHAGPVESRPPFVEDLDGSLSVVDVASGRVLRTLEPAGCARPHASWQLAGRAFVTCEDEGVAAVLDLDSGATVQRWETGQRGSHVLALHPASGTLAVSNTGDGSVTLIDLASGDREIVPLGDGAEGSAVVEERGELWVGNAREGSVSIVDLARRAEVARIEELCAMPISLAEARGTVWVACFAGRELVGVDAATRTVTRRFPLAHAPLHVLPHPELPLAYVSLPRRNAVAEIELAGGAEVRRFPVGIEPDGLRWAGS